MKYARATPRVGSLGPETMSGGDPNDLSPDELLAEQLVDAALRTMAIPPMLLPTIRATLIAELLVTVQGQRLLRLVRPDPQVTSSDEIIKPGAAQTTKPKKRGRLP